MKKLLTLLFAGIVCYGCQKDFVDEPQDNSPATRAASGETPDHYYWSNGVKIPLTVNENKLFVLAETSKYESVSKLAITAGSKAQRVSVMNDYNSLGIQSSSKSTKIRTSVTSFTLDSTNLRSVDTKDMVYVAPYFKTSDGADIGITNVFSVQLKGDQDLAKLEKIAQENNLEILGENQFDPSIYYLSCTKESKGNALEMANYMYESGAFEYATPEFIVESMGAAEPNDEYFRSQWNLYNRTSSGIDIHYLDAMSIVSSQNLSNIIVAVVDNGIYMPHTDLPLHNVSYNAHTGGSTSGLYGDHGTMVAGIIGATANNNRVGIAGVASGVKIMPISVCYTKDGQRLGIKSSTSTHFANAIRFAANNGARIINNSWGFGGSSPIPDINNAITHAYDKGCIVVFCSMNDNGPVSQPQASAPSPTLVVGAIDQTGNRASYSNYGSSLDVVAPGSNIWTTTWTGGYTDLYSGTSFAAPHVSGIAALMLSKNPNLTVQGVVDVIEKTAREVGGYSYTTTSGRPNGRWNNQMGYGLVDAYQAVYTVSQPAPAKPGIVAPGPVLSAGEQQWAGVPAGVKGYWVQPGTCVVSINQNYDQAATYEWDTGGLPSAQLTGPYTRSITTLGNNSIYEIKCRAYKNGQYSAWGTLYLYVSTSAPKSIYLLKDKPKEDEFEESDDENPDSTEIDETITLE